MKKVLLVFSILIVCNISFSQELKPELSLEKKPIEDQEEPVFKCYPNPVEEDLFIIGTDKIKSIEIIDVLGNSIAIYQFEKSIIRLKSF